MKPSFNPVYPILLLLLLCCVSFSWSAFYFTADEGFSIGRSSFNKYDIISTDGAGNYTSVMTSLTSLIPPEASIDGLHVVGNGTTFLSLDVDAQVQGTLFHKQDIICWNGTTATLFWDGLSHGIPAEANVESVMIGWLNPLDFVFTLGEAAPLVISGVTTIIDKSAVVQYEQNTAGDVYAFTTVYFTGPQMGLPDEANSESISKVYSDMTILTSGDIDMLIPTVGGTSTYFKKSDFMNFNANNGSFATTAYFSGSANGIPDEVNLKVACFIPHPPVAGMYANQTIGFEPLNVFFTDTSNYGIEDVYYYFGDGFMGWTDYQENIAHTFYRNGPSGSTTYQVMQRVMNLYGESTAFLKVTVFSSAPVANFYATVTIGNGPFTTAFFDGSSNTPTSWNWNFGDGSGTTAQNPVHTYTDVAQVTTYTVRLQVSNAYGNSSTQKVGYITIVPGKQTLLPDLKMYVNQGLVPAFVLKDYDFISGATSYMAIGSAHAGVLSPLAAGTTFQILYDKATVETNIFRSYFSNGSMIDNSNKGKYATYRMLKLPIIGLRPGQSYDVNLLKYTSDKDGIKIAPSFGKTSSVVVSNSSIISTSWVTNTVLRITALSGFTSGPGISVDVIASPNTGPVFGFDQDKERLWVYPNIIQGGTFSAASDTTDFAYQLVGDRATLPGSIYYVANRADLAGTNASGCLALSFNGSSQGVKMTLKRNSFKVYEKNTWYTARMKLFSSTTINDLQVLLYHYKGSIPDESHINGAANVLFGVSTIWTWIETPLYTTDTGLGYPQLHFKNGISTSTGNIYIDEVQVIKAAPALMNVRSNPRLHYPYGTFSHLSIFGMGWSTTQTYMIATAVPGYSVVSGQLHLNFNGAGTGNQVGGKFTARSQDTAYTVYTPSSQLGYGVGMKVDVTKISGTFNDYNSIVYYATYGVPTYGSVNVIYAGGQILGAAEFGRITDGVHLFAGIANQPYQQMQFAVKSGTAGVLGINSVDFIRDMDDPNYGDSVLFP